MPEVCCPSVCWETPAMLITLIWYLCMCVYFCSGLCWPLHPYMYACPVFSPLGLRAPSRAISGLEFWHPDPRGCVIRSLTGNWEVLASTIWWRTPYVYPCSTSGCSSLDKRVDIQVERNWYSKVFDMSILKLFCTMFVKTPSFYSVAGLVHAIARAAATPKLKGHWAVCKSIWTASVCGNRIRFVNHTSLVAPLPL